MTSSPEFQPILINRKGNDPLEIKAQDIDTAKNQVVMERRSPHNPNVLTFEPCEAIEVSDALRAAAYHLDPALAPPVSDDSNNTAETAIQAAFRMIEELQQQVAATERQIADIATAGMFTAAQVLQIQSYIDECIAGRDKVLAAIKQYDPDTYGKVMALINGDVPQEPAASGEPEREAVVPIVMPMPRGWHLFGKAGSWQIKEPGSINGFTLRRDGFDISWTSHFVHILVEWFRQFPYPETEHEVAAICHAFIAAGGMDPHARIASVTFTTDRAGAEAAR